MTREIKLEIMSRSHMTKQPEGKRYALVCAERDTFGVACPSKDTGGFIKNFTTYAEAKELGIAHPHAVLVLFFPHIDEEHPSEDFIADLNTQEQSLNS